MSEQAPTLRETIQATRDEAVRSRGFIRASETQLSKVIAECDAALAKLDAAPPAEPEQPQPETEEPTDPTPIPQRPGVGINLEEPKYWSSVAAYADVLRQSEFTSGERRVFWDLAPNLYPHDFTVEGDAQVNDTGHGLIIRHKDGSPMRDVPPNTHVWLKGQEGKKWNAAYLADLAPFSVLRVMDWLDTNGSTSEPNWSRLEDAIDLCNVNGSDLWLCIGHLWSETATHAALTLCREKLKGRLYVEASNEWFNSDFDAPKWAEAQSGARMKWRAWYEFVCAHIESRFKLAGEVYADNRDRLTRVLAGSANQDDLTREFAARVDPSLYEAGSIAAYFSNHNQRDQLSQLHSDGKLTVDAMLDLVEQALPYYSGQYRKAADIFRAKGKPLIAYEGGSHMSHAGQPWNSIAIEANRSERMVGLYKRNADSWREAGGGLIVYYNDCRMSATHPFGHLEWTGQQPRPAKYRAITDYMEAR